MTKAEAVLVKAGDEVWFNTPGGRLEKVVVRQVINDFGPPRAPIEEFPIFVLDGGNYVPHKFLERTARLTPRSIQQIVRDVASERGLTWEQLIGKTRAQRAVIARHHAMYLCRMEVGASLGEIARVFDRDHSTVVYGIRQAARRIKEAGG